MMKRVFLFILLVISTSVLLSCSLVEEEKDISAFVELSVEEKQSIQKEVSTDVIEMIFNDYGKDGDPMKIIRFLGNYDNAIVVMFDGVHLDEVSVETINNIDFYYSSSNRIIVWFDGKFYRLHNAYNLGLIGQNDLLAIHAKYNKTINDDMVNVTFQLDNGMEANIVQIQKGSKLPKPVDPIKEGYAFVGWFVDEKRWSFAVDCFEQDTIISARWTSEYKNIKFILYENEMIEQTVKYGEKITTIPSPKRDNYLFKGWCQEDGKFFNFRQNIYNDETFYAKWEYCNAEMVVDIAIEYFKENLLVKREWVSGDELPVQTKVLSGDTGIQVDIQIDINVLKEYGEYNEKENSWNVQVASSQTMLLPITFTYEGISKTYTYEIKLKPKQ